MVVERFAVLPEVEVRFCEVDEVEVLRDGVVVVLRDGVVVVLRDTAVEVRDCEVEAVEVLRDGAADVAERFAELLDVEVRDCEDDEVRDWASSIGAEAVIAIATRDAVISVVIFFMV